MLMLKPKAHCPLSVLEIWRYSFVGVLANEEASITRSCTLVPRLEWSRFGSSTFTFDNGVSAAPRFASSRMINLKSIRVQIQWSPKLYELQSKSRFPQQQHFSGHWIHVFTRCTPNSGLWAIESGGFWLNAKALGPWSPRSHKIAVGGGEVGSFVNCGRRRSFTTKRQELFCQSDKIWLIASS